MTAISINPSLWPYLHPVLIAHDVGGSRDRSTAVVGGFSGYAPGILGITEFNEMPQRLYGSDRASALRRSEQRQQLWRAVIRDLWPAGDSGAYRSPRRRHAVRSRGESAKAVYPFIMSAGRI
jgi:hypothetical protein